jgi:Family of unknown function (DUF6886)
VRASHLFHFSEDPHIKIFRPHVPVGRDERLVWAIDEEHSFLYYFPRECPRILLWALPATTEEDRSRFLGEALRVATIEGAWLPRLESTRLFVYTLPSDSFECLNDIGMHVSRVPVRPLSVQPVGDLKEALGESEVELRTLPSLGQLAADALESTLHYSMIRMRNAGSPEAQLLG